MKKTGLRCLFVALVLLLVPLPSHAQDGKRLRLAYVEWDCSTASTHLVKAILEDRLGYTVEALAVSAPIMWVSLKTGDADAMVSAWLPSTHKDMQLAVADGVEIIGTVVEGARLGLAVPDYVPLRSIEELDAHATMFRNVIVGIDPGAGIMGLTGKLLEDYGFTTIKLAPGSSALMTERLAEAVRKREWIVVTAWSPHWMFGTWNMRYLDDPKKSLGEAEYIGTAASRNLKNEHPEAHAFLSRFKFPDTGHMERYMSWNRVNHDPEENARRFMRENPDLVDRWLGN